MRKTTIILNKHGNKNFHSFKVETRTKENKPNEKHMNRISLFLEYFFCKA